MGETASRVLQVAQHDLVQRSRGEQATAASEASLANIIKKSTGELPMTINFLGLCKAGKSQLQSSMIGRDILPSASEPCTSVPTIYRHSSDREKCRVFYAHFGEDLTAQVGEEAIFEGPAGDCRRHLNDLNDRARALAVRLSQGGQEVTNGGEDFIIAAMREEGVPMYAVVETYIQGLVEAGVPEDVLFKCQFVDSPGKGEAFNPVVDLTIKQITALSDLIVVVMDYKAMGTDNEGALWQSLGEQRPDLLRELDNRCLYFLSFADAGGAGAMTVEQACEHARLKVAECIKCLPVEEQFTGGSGLASAAARHMLRYFREGVVPSEDVMKGAIAPMVDADFPDDVTFAEASEEMSEEQWNERLQESGLPSLERKMAIRLRDVDGLREAVCYTDLKRIASCILANINATLDSLSETSATLQQQQNALTLAIANVQQYCKDEIKPLIASSKTSALKSINSTVDSMEASLQANASSLINVAERGQKQVFENEAAAQAHVQKLAAEVSRLLRESFVEKANALRTVINKELGYVNSNFQNIVIPSFKAFLNEAFKSLEVDIPEVGDIDLDDIEAEQETVRRALVCLGTIDDGEIERGIKNFVKVNHFTEKTVEVKTRRVCVGTSGFWFWKKNVYANQSYTEEVDVKRSNYPVQPGVVERFVHQLYMNNLATVKANFTEAAVAALDYIAQTLTGAINAPLVTAKARVDLAVRSKATDHDVQNTLIAALREQCELLEEVRSEH